MFKYIAYTPFTDDYTTHIFNELNDKCTIHRFDVPFVSVEFNDIEDFNALMAYQNTLINASEVDYDTFAGVVKDTAQYYRMKEIANDQYTLDMSPISQKYTPEERDTWPSQAAEANAVKEGSATETPYLTALAESDGTTVQEAADKILANKREYDEYAASALSRKWVTFDDLKNEVGL